MSELSGSERRITLRMLSYWEKLRHDRDMPSRDDINPDDIQDLWDNCFMVPLKEGGQPDHSNTYIGKAILTAYHQGLAEENDHRLISPDVSTFILNHRKLFESHKPLLEEGEFENMLLGMVKYRQCLLPLGENGRIHAILGGMTFKVFAPQTS